MTYRFGAFELTARGPDLHHAGERVALEPKPLRVLLKLVSEAGKVVGKDELMDQVWEGQTVTDHVLTRCINVLRHTLTKAGQEPIINSYGRGYRFALPVRVLERPEKSKGPGAAELGVGAKVPGRPHWVLLRKVQGTPDAWLAVNCRTHAVHLFRFAGDNSGLANLRRDAAIFGQLVCALGSPTHLPRMAAPDFDRSESGAYFMELEWSDDSALSEWVEAQGGLAAVALELIALRLQAGSGERHSTTETKA